jgi:predicted amidohydrolase YtcJ
VDETADTIFYNGTILTMVDALPRAGALAVKGQMIVSVGSEEEVLQQAGDNTIMVDLEGRTLMPGFVDSHTHIFNDHDALETDLAGAQELAISNGITTLGNMYSTEDFIAEMRSLDDSGDLLVRTSLYLAITTNCGENTGEWWKDHTPTRNSGERLRIGGLKVFADGGTCREIAASQDILPDFGRGELFFTQEEMDAMFAQAEDLGYQLAIHAQGDLAVEQVLNSIAKVNAGDANPLRHRIEHNSLVRDELRPLYAEYDVVATLFGWHPVCAGISWTPFYQEIGEDLRGMLDANPTVHFAWHGDDPYWPPISPLMELASMVTKTEPDKSGDFCEPPEWLADNAITAEEGLQLMTTGAAYSLFREDEVGSLEVGKYADLIILNGDPTEVDPMGLWDLQVMATLIGGELVYCADEAQALCKIIR